MNIITKGVFGLACAAVIFSGSAMTAELSEEIMAEMMPNMVKVQYHLRFDQGDEPQAPGFTEKCPGCGRYHVNRARSALRQERPAEVP